MAQERELFERFLRGEEMPPDDRTPWHDLIRANVAAGKTMTRVKVVRRPFTDYTRWLMSWGISNNVAAGEDYRIIDVTERHVELPFQDFWMFDESTVVLMNYNVDGSMRERLLLENAEVGQYVAWRDIAMKESVPFGEYRT